MDHDGGCWGVSCGARRGGRATIQDNWTDVETTLEADSTVLERFKREASLTASFDHPDIVRVFDFGTQGGIRKLVVQVHDHSAAPKDQYVVAVDSVDAGPGDMVMYASGCPRWRV